MPALSTDVENQEIGTPEQTGTTKKLKSKNKYARP